VGAYVVRRLLWAIFVVVFVTFITFVIFYLLPAGDPALRFAGRVPTEETLATVREQLGLDKPWYHQYWIFLSNLVTGDEYGWPGLGYSYVSNISVLSEIRERAPRTLLLILGAATIWLVVGVTIGVLSAVKRRSAADRLAMGFVLIGISTPVFWLGLMALFVFWNKLGWTAGTGYVPPTESLRGFFSHMILPWFVLALLFAAIYARMTRNTLLETLGEDYIRTARAKGLSERQVIVHHALRASLAPIVTMLGMDIALLVGGAIITESVFNIQGLGWLAIRGTLDQDLPIVLGVVMVATVAVVIMNLVVDIAYAFLDPRVRYA
jgi:peptide/nickel transport system permease protein